MYSTFERELIAQAVHAAIRSYNESIGDAALPAWEGLDPQLKASYMSGVDACLNGATPRQQHENWMRTRIADGWVYGPVTDRAKKINQCLVPYDELPPEQRIKDELFQAAVRSACAVIGAL